MFAYQCVFLPCDTLLLVGIGIGEAFNLTSLSTEETVQVGANLVALRLYDGVALCTSGLEEAGTLLGITYRDTVSDKTLGNR